MSKVPQIHVTKSPESQVSLCFWSMVTNPESQIYIRFRFRGQFETSAPKDPKMTLNTKRSKGPPCMCFISTPESQISLLFAPWLSVFKLHAILRQVHQMTWKTTRNNKRAKVPHTHVTTAPESQISFYFALWSAIFELQAILRQAHRMIPK